MNESNLNLEEQLIVDEQLNNIQKNIDELINQVYLMGYNKGIRQKEKHSELS